MTYERVRPIHLLIYCLWEYSNSKTSSQRLENNYEAFQTLPALDVPLDLAIKSAHGNGVEPHVLPHQNCVSHVRSIAGNKNK